MLNGDGVILCHIFLSLTEGEETNQGAARLHRLADRRYGIRRCALSVAVMLLR